MTHIPADHLAALVPRQRHWERRLVEWAHSVLGAPYAWGETDCVSLACQALCVLTGQPIAKPAYTTALGAFKALRREQRLHGSIGQAFVARGLIKIASPKLAQGGDLLIIEAGSSLPLIAIVVGTSLVSADDLAQRVIERRFHELVDRADVAVYRLPG